MTGRPTRASAAIALGSSALLTVLATTWHPVASLAALLGTACVAAGLYRRSRSLPGVGFGAFVVAIAAGAIAGAPTEPVLLGTLCAVLAWDAGRRSITLGVQLGREADALRLELLHAAASGAVGAFSVGIAYGLSRSLSVALPAFAVLLLCGCVLALLFARRA
ncbi:hypothetical protein [Saliphagus sp. LR7]|uniref:DUF7519 family protein n=1 Tax=Saliphagus sp. LR7 TaxID=2282654 RepID=UPI0013006DDF|nr:hypothetical protein [Saliphagus sp. LR7]